MDYGKNTLSWTDNNDPPEKFVQTTYHKGKTGEDNVEA